MSDGTSCHGPKRQGRVWLGIGMLALASLAPVSMALAAKPGLPLSVDITTSTAVSTIDRPVLRIRLVSVVDLPRLELSATLQGGELPDGQPLWQGPVAANTPIELEQRVLPEGPDWTLRVQIEAEAANGRRLALVREHRATTTRRVPAASTAAGRELVSEGRRLRVFDLPRVVEPR